MSLRPVDAVGLATAVARTWGARGLGRRSRYELERRSGWSRRAERAWLETLSGASVRLAPMRPIAPPRQFAATAPPPEVHLYGALPVAVDWPGSWRRHPFTGHRYPDAHWSDIGEGDPGAGDIKDLWEIGRLTWLGPWLQASASDGAAERCWRTLESFVHANPAYRGAQWMCGQESALRGIVIASVASALSETAAATDARRELAARALAETVGRVRTTVGYALSQRNNHAISEGAFLWTASALVDDLPERDDVLRVGRETLTEAIADQWYADGSYAQHSPTYQRLALHALLWVLAVARAGDRPAPDDVVEVVERSTGFLSSIVEPTSGLMPNLGGNDGALLFDLTPRPRRDFRPLLVHAATAIGAPSPFEPGPWDDEARWFGLEPAHESESTPVATKTIAIHAHRGLTSHAVIRGGPLRHRPAHADQLHVDVWIGAINVALDAGSYRYTAPQTWGNALADEAVHNVVRVPGEPQAVRRGRFFWTRWCEARVVATWRSDEVDGTLLELVLPSKSVLRRLVVRRGDSHLVMDRSSDVGAVVRWNLPLGASVEQRPGSTTATGVTWQAQFSHGGTARVLTPDEEDRRSGWHAPTYGVREPIVAMELHVDSAGHATAWFGPASTEPGVPPGWKALDATTDAELRDALAVLTSR